MIDLHSHVLPGVDDGSSSVEQTAEMLRIWKSFGFEMIGATPHLAGDLSESYRTRIEQSRDSIDVLLVETGVSLAVGFEIMLDPGLEARLLRGDPLTLGSSRAVLVEVPFMSWPTYTEEVIFNLQLAGFRPILAHPERYDAVQANPDLALNLGRRAVVLQLSFASFAGVHGKPAQRSAERLVESAVPIVLASDAHGSGQRLKAIPEGLRRVENMVGPERTHQMTTSLPGAMLNDDEWPEPIASSERSGASEKRSWFRRGN